jgi:S-adenosylmethionine uptake transporter
MGFHLLRVLLSVITLSASFFAIPRVPFAVFTAVGFTRPLVTMVMAALLLRETIGARRWSAAGVAFAGVLVAVNPGAVAWSWGLAALVVVVFSGSGAVIATRRLREAPPIVMMTFYTAGLTVFSAPLALVAWEPVAPGHLLPLLLVGCFAQSAQLCFLRAHYHGAAGFLSVLGYLSLVLSIGVGYFAFGEEPGPSFALGAFLVVSSALWATVDLRSIRIRS